MLEIKEALDSYWVSLVAAYLTVLAVDTSKLDSSFSGNDIEWKEIFKLSIKSKTEHTIKLAYTAYEQEEFYKGKFNLKSWQFEK